MKVLMQTETLIKKEGTKTVWIVSDTEKYREISLDLYKDHQNTGKKFAKSFGGSCSHQKGYTPLGYTLTKETLTREDRQKKTVRTYKVVNK